MIKDQITKNTQLSFSTVLCLLTALLAVNGEVWAQDILEEQATTAQSDKGYSFSAVVLESVAGDVYSDPSKWQDLSYSNLFSEGWDKPWASPPNGSGGAPRQGWLNAYDGVFYRLGIAVFGWQHGLGSGDGYTGDLVNYTPLNQRFEIQTDIPVASNGGGAGNNSQTNFGDFKITPRMILSESKDVTQSFNVTFRTPTGNSFNGNNVAAVTPQYQFWTNAWKGLVVRGGAGFTIPYSGDISKSGARTTFDTNLAVGYYFTPHDFTPFGDMVWYLSTNVSQAIDNRSKNSGTFVSLTPGFRTHLGQNWYLLGAVEVPVTNPQPYDYQVLGGIMKVF
jgi:hypothetical protein